MILIRDARRPRGRPCDRAGYWRSGRAGPIDARCRSAWLACEGAWLPNADTQTPLSRHRFLHTKRVEFWMSVESDARRGSRQLRYFSAERRPWRSRPLRPDRRCARCCRRRPRPAGARHEPIRSRVDVCPSCQSTCCRRDTHLARAVNSHTHARGRRHSSLPEVPTVGELMSKGLADRTSAAQIPKMSGKRHTCLVKFERCRIDARGKVCNGVNISGVEAAEAG